MTSSKQSSVFVVLLPLAAILAAGLLLFFPTLGRASDHLQIPTGSIATVTGTPVGAIAVILENEQGYINVRSGPSTIAYPIVGLITAGSSVPAIGRTSGGDWIKIVYASAPGGVGWIWGDLVDVRGRVSIVEAPPTPTPATTATIDPTLAAQFLVEAIPTRLPTYTAPPPVVNPTMPADLEINSTTTGPVPMILIIASMLVIGLMGLFVSLLRSR